MRICSAKLLSALSTTAALVTLLPGITFAAPAQPSSTGITTAQTPTGTTPTTPSGGSMSTSPSSSTTTGQKPGSRKKMSSEINAVLTPTQRTQFAQARKAGKKPSEALQGLNLTSTQQSQIDAIIAKYKQPGSGSSTMSPTQPGTMQH